MTSPLFDLPVAPLEKPDEVSATVFNTYWTPLYNTLANATEPQPLSALLGLLPNKSPKTVKKHLETLLYCRPDLEDALLPAEDDDVAASKKTAIIESIFDARYDAGLQSVPEDQRIVTMRQVRDAIAAYNAPLPEADHLSDRNVANFFKDIKRSYNGFDRHWPQSVFARGYTGRQLTGEGSSFEFVKRHPSQEKPSARLYEPFSVTSDEYLKSRIRIETLSLSREKRGLLRSDESHITQISVELRVLERCLSESPLGFETLKHLLNNAKMRRAEIDAVFSGTLEPQEGANPKTVAVTCEVKGRAEDVFEDQLVRQVNMLPLFGLKCDLVLAVAIKLVARHVLRVIEFEPVPFEDAAKATSLTMAKSYLVELHPPLNLFGS
jgi:hypothetical protein